MTSVNSNYSIHILLVEDTPSERLFIAEVLHQLQVKDCKITISQCEDGQQALAICQQQTIDLVISDWRMPNLSGIELCQQLKKQQDAPYILLLTGNNQSDDLVHALASGADDYLAKPFKPKVLNIRVLAAIRLIMAQQVLRQQNKALTKSYNTIDKMLQQKKAELKQAAQLQQSLLPDALLRHNQWQVSHLFSAANELAGDMFQCFAIDDNSLGFYLIDVSGHGAGAAMQSFTLAQSLNPNRVDWQQSASELMAYLNSIFDDPSQQGQFATVIIGKLNTLSGEWQLCNAGHPQPLIISAQQCESLDMPASLPIGIDEHTQYIDWDFTLAEQHQLMIFSDGIYEITHPDLGMYGLDRLKNQCKSSHQICSSSMLGHLHRALKLWQEGSNQDDMSIMLFSPKSIA